MPNQPKSRRRQRRRMVMIESMEARWLLSGAVVDPNTVEIAHQLGNDDLSLVTTQLPVPMGTVTETRSYIYRWDTRLRGNDTTGPAIPLFVSVDWGDGTSYSFPDPDAYNPGTPAIATWHAYNQAGDYTATFSYESSDGSRLIAFGLETVHVIQDSPGGLDVSTPTGATFTGTVGTFHSDTPPASVLISWGDPRSAHAVTDGTLTDLGNGDYSVSGSHTFYDPGTFVVTAAQAPYTFNGGGPEIQSTFTVSGPVLPVAANLVPLPHAIANIQGTFTAATFTSVPTVDFNDPNGIRESMSIDWGDGSPLSDNPNFFPIANEVSATAIHTYATPGAYNVTATFYENGAAVAAVTQILQVDATSSEGGMLNAQTGRAFNWQVGEFSTTQTPGKVDQTYDAVIDWGDGQNSAGTLIALGNGNYVVDGTHAYATPGDYLVQVTTGVAPPVSPTPTIGPPFVIAIAVPFTNPTTSVSIVSRVHVTGETVLATPRAKLTVPKIPKIVAADPTTGLPQIQATLTGISPDMEIPDVVIDYGNGTAPITQPAKWVNDHFEAPLFAPFNNFNPINYPIFVSAIPSLLVIPPYQLAGKYTLSVVVKSGSTILAAAHVPVVVSPNLSASYAYTAATVSPPPITGLTDTPTVGTWSAVLKTLTTSAAGYTATIQWGDGTRSSGTATAEFEGNPLRITAQHVYKKSGTYHSVAIVKFHGKIVQRVKSDVIVAQNTPQGRSLHAGAGRQFSGIVGALYLAGLENPTSALIDWGDGTQSIGSFTNEGTASEDVIGSHIYQRKGVYHITATPLFAENVEEGQLDESASQIVRSTISVV